MGACCAFDFPQLLPQQSLSWKLSACFICSQEGKKSKERKIYDGNPTESSSAIPWSHSLFQGCTLWQAVGTRGAVALGKMGCVNQKWSQSRPARAVSSNCNMFIQFTFPATHFCLLSPARDTTQSRLFQFLSSKAGSSFKSPCNCQELCNSAIRVSNPVRNERPWGSEGRVFATFLRVKLQHKAPSSALTVWPPRLIWMPPLIGLVPLPRCEADRA